MNRRARGFCLTAVAGAAVATLGVASARAAVIDPDLEQALLENDGEVDFIAQFGQGLDLGAFPGQGAGGGNQLAALLWALRNQADRSQKTAVALLQAGGATKIIQLWSINALAARAPADVVQDLASLPGVERIELDSTLAAPSPEPAAAAVPEWNIAAVGATDAWTQGLTGAGTVVAAMDTGVDALHPDLASQWRGGSNSWFDPNGEHATPYDRTGHGTAVMSLMVGGDGGGSAIGVAPGAQWIAVKIFNDADTATLSAIHQGFQWLLDPDGNPLTDDAPDVVNNSWGFAQLAGTCYLEFEPDLEVLKAVGIAVVFSAGNQALNESPANNLDGFATGAVDSSLTLASTSGRGPSACDGSLYPEVVAPGVGVRAADLTFGGTYPDSYASVSGTSFAAPHVAGIMALLRQAYSDATVAQLEQAVMDGAFDIEAAGPDNDSGYGLANATDALAWLAAAPPPCTDFDGDGFFAEATCGTEADCNDLDAGINPAACDIKRDGIDQDCDGVDRTNGKSCPVSDGGGGDTTTGIEGKGQTCSDGLDNDGDGAIDCGDSDCSKNKVCK